MKYVEKLPWIVVLLLCVTLGLSPFDPPHVWEKLVMLFSGNLVRAVDWFDLFFHGSPWLLALAKAGLRFRNR